MTLLLVFTDGGLPLPSALAVGCVAALLFGGLWTVTFGRSMRRLIGRLYAGDPKLVPPPPSAAYTVRILASLMTAPMFAVGGHLYAGPAELAFVPHTRNRPRDRAPRVLRWEQVQRVEALTRPAPALARIFSSEPLSYLRVAVEDGEWLLKVPEANTIAAELRRFLPEPPGAV
jgi:hypothetical protein